MFIILTTCLSNPLNIQNPETVGREEEESRHGSNSLKGGLSGPCCVSSCHRDPTSSVETELFLMFRKTYTVKSGDLW